MIYIHNMDPNIKHIQLKDDMFISKEEKKALRQQKAEEKVKAKAKEPPRKRIITNTTKWIETCATADISNEIQYITEIATRNISNEVQCNIIIQQIKQKISGYRSQDVLKNLLDENQLVDVNTIISLFREAQHICNYCRRPVQLLYENVREPRQWSLDRIDNAAGHNRENLFLSCLECNLRRGTMYHERYAFTKQLDIVKIVPNK